MCTSMSVRVELDTVNYRGDSKILLEVTLTAIYNAIEFSQPIMKTLIQELCLKLDHVFKMRMHYYATVETV